MFEAQQSGHAWVKWAYKKLHQAGFRKKKHPFNKII